MIDGEPESRVRLGLLGASVDTRFEIGSVTKALTGMLLADTVERGRLSLTTEVGEVVPSTDGSDLASVTLLELATHTSGLPRLPFNGSGVARALPYAVWGRNPYRTSPASVIAAAVRQPLRGRGQRRYSNIGTAVLGEVLALSASTDYSSLLTEAILRPLGMEATAVSTKGCRAPLGRSAWGLPRDRWVLHGYAPAGGILSTIEDMVRLARRLLDGSAPGVAALDPINGVQTDRPDRRTGLFWFIDGPTDQVPAITWHDGGTGGYSAFLALIPDVHRAVIILQRVGGNVQHLQRIALDVAR